MLANAAFYIFVPALLFRTTARLDFAALPWLTLAAFFVPVLLLLAAVYVWQRRAQPRRASCAAAPAVRAISATFGNTVQVGIPMALALFGEAGLGIHMMIVSLHALTLLTVLTALVELDLARARSRTPAQAARTTLAATLATTVRNTIIHPVVLPVLAGMAWNATGLALPPVARRGAAAARQRGRAAVPGADRHVARVLRVARRRAQVRCVLSLLKLLAAAGAGAGDRALGLRPRRPAAGGGGDGRGAAGRQQRADLQPALPRRSKPRSPRRWCSRRSASCSLRRCGCFVLRLLGAK